MSHIKIKLLPQGSIGRDLSLDVQMHRAGTTAAAAVAATGGLRLSVSEVTFPYAPNLDKFNNEPLMTVFISDVQATDTIVTVQIIPDDGAGLKFVPTDDSEVTWTTAPLTPFVLGTLTIPAGLDQTRFRVEGLAVGSYTVTAEAVGFDSATGNVTVIECPEQDPDGFEVIFTAWEHGFEGAEQIWVYGRVDFGPAPTYTPTYTIGQIDTASGALTQPTAGPITLHASHLVFEGAMLSVRRLGYNCPGVVSWDVGGTLLTGTLGYTGSFDAVYMFNQGFGSPAIGETDSAAITFDFFTGVGGPTPGKTLTVSLTGQPQFIVHFLFA